MLDALNRLRKLTEFQMEIIDTIKEREVDMSSEKNEIKLVKNQQRWKDL